MSTLKTATEIKEWMDNKLHESDKFREYVFELPFIVIPEKDEDPNWTLRNPDCPIIGKNVDPNDEEYLKAISHACNIFFEALTKFTLNDEY